MLCQRQIRNIALAVLVVFAISRAPCLLAQSAASQAPTAQPMTPKWQIDAGGKMAFEVASVKLSTDGEEQDRNFPIDDGDRYAPNGGLLTIRKFPLSTIIAFAYKLPFYEWTPIQDRLPKALAAERFDIEARAPGTPTKDQMRLMMQSLLADRFKLAVHFEMRQLPVYELVVNRPGRLGTRIRPHTSDSPCLNAPPTPGTPAASVATIAGGFPEMCGQLVGFPSPSAPGQMRLGARDVTMAIVASFVSIQQLFGVDRRVFDKTGLTGTFDFFVDFTPQLSRPLPPGSGIELDPTGPTLMEGLKDQLGLKLVPQTGPVDVLVIDHVEEPSPN